MTESKSKSPPIAGGSTDGLELQSLDLKLKKSKSLFKRAVVQVEAAGTVLDRVKLRTGITVEIIGGPEEGAQISSQHYFSGGAKPITLDAMRHLGWTDGADLDSIRGTTSITLYDEAYQGELRQKVRVHVPRVGLQTPEAKRKNPQQAKAFLSRLVAPAGGDAFADVSSDEPIAGTTRPVDDDLPF